MTRRTCRALACAALWAGAVVFTTAQGGGAVTPARPAPVSRAPALDTTMFATSGECVACHNALVAPDGEDVSIGSMWRGTIMANAARDPYFHAGIRRETMDHPARAGDIEDECAACHMPAATQVAHAAGRTGEVFAHLPIAGRAGTTPLQDVAADGITCTVCHQISRERLGTHESFNGGFVVEPPLADGARRANGPYDPDAGRRRIMQSVSGFEQVQAPHIRESALCATCHTLITRALGPDGRVIGSLPEQVNFQEWQHSAYAGEQRSCQSCHMPAVDGPVRVASALGEYRDSLSRHLFVGGNAWMLRLLNKHRAELGVEATSAELEAAAKATLRQLEQDTAEVAIERAVRTAGSLAVDVAVTNRTGHKFPTGYPSRRAWLHIVARDASGRVLFESGRPNVDGSVEGSDSDADAGRFEPHYAEITRPDQVQVYESIMGTVSAAPTTGLLQAVQYLKDNRLLPRGFDKNTAAPEIAVHGEALTDVDFTATGDRVRYRVPVDASGPLTVQVELFYQSVSYRWAHNLEGYDAPEPQRFLGYYKDLAPASAILIGRASATVP